ncbi:hypothetical protein GCM10027612_03690 [Microbispora bryophytorum subsp. camponoti]
MPEGLGRRGPARLAGPAHHATRPRRRGPAPGELGRGGGLVARRIKEITADRGPDAVAVFGGGGLTNEKAYLLGKFARVALGTSQVDYNGRFCMSSAAAAAHRAFGLDRGLPFPLTDLEGADAVLLAGANPAETMPPFLSHLRRAMDAGGLIVVDPRRTPTAERAALHLAPVPGTDLALALGIFHAAVADGRLDHGFVGDRTTGFDEAWRVAAAWWPERVERVTGVAAADQRRAAAILAEAASAYVLTARGTEQHSTGVDTVGAWINLALALGLPGRRGSGWGCLTGQGNGQGGREHGQKADQLPGYRRIDDPAARAHVAGVWGSSRPRCPARDGRRSNCSTRSALRTARPRCWSSPATRSCPRRTRPGWPSGWPRSTSSWSPTSCCRRPPGPPTWCCRSPSGPRRTAR